MSSDRQIQESIFGVWFWTCCLPGPEGCAWAGGSLAQAFLSVFVATDAWFGLAFWLAVALCPFSDGWFVLPCTEADSVSIGINGKPFRVITCGASTSPYAPPSSRKSRAKAADSRPVSCFVSLFMRNACVARAMSWGIPQTRTCQSPCSFMIWNLGCKETAGKLQQPRC